MFIRSGSRTPLPAAFRPALALAHLVCAMALVWLPASALAQTEGSRIDKVEVIGLVSYKPEQVLARLKTKAGQTYNSLDIREDLTELAKIMRTANVGTEPSPEGGLIVRFTVSEFPRFHKLQVIGNDKLKTARIETLAGIKPGEVLDERAQSSLRKALTNEYKALGLPQAKVTLNLIPVAPEAGKTPAYPEADLQVVIDEGRQVLVKDVIVEGNASFSALRLRMLLDTKGSFGFVKNYYDDAVFEGDLERLRDFYAAHGYFDAHIERGMFQEQTIKNQPVVSPVVRVTEGERYKFGKAAVRGARLISQADLLAPLTPLEGQLFNGRSFARALDQIRQLYVNHGLLTTEINPKYEYDAAGKILNMTIEISEKELIFVNKVKLVRPTYEIEDEKTWFRGWYERMSPPVKDEVIMRESLLKPGDVYNKALERETQRRLAALGVFETAPQNGQESPRVYNEPTGEAGLHNFVIEAADSPTGAISAGVGFGDASGLFFYGQLTERNVHGLADVFSLQLMLGTRESSASVSYLDRHLGASTDSLLSRLYYENLSRPGYRASIAGLSSEWGHPLVNSDWTRYLRGRLEVVSLSEREDHDADEDLDQTYPVLASRLRFEQDTRYPFGERAREGYLQSYGAEVGYAGGPLIRLEGSRDQYRPLTELLTWRLNASAGLMPYSADTVPIHERFFLGGDTDLRGFRYRGAGYRDSEDDDLPIGGAAKLLVKNEVLFPIYEPVSGVVFADIGMLGKSPVSWQMPRASLGTGVRLNLQKVQVALDLALPVLTESDDDTRFFHFSLQSSFR